MPRLEYSGVLQARGQPQVYLPLLHCAEKSQQGLAAAGNLRRMHVHDLQLNEEIATTHPGL